jgi:hypothetical protein
MRWVECVSDVLGEIMSNGSPLTKGHFIGELG